MAAENGGVQEAEVVQNRQFIPTHIALPTEFNYQATSVG